MELSFFPLQYTTINTNLTEIRCEESLDFFSDMWFLHIIRGSV